MRKQKPNRKPILTSPDLALFWEVGLSSVSHLASFFPGFSRLSLTDLPHPLVPALAPPRPRRMERGQRRRTDGRVSGAKRAERNITRPPSVQLPWDPLGSGQGISGALLLRRGRSAALLPSTDPPTPGLPTASRLSEADPAPLSGKGGWLRLAWKE